VPSLRLRRKPAPDLLRPIFDDSMNEKSAIIAKLLQPASNVGGLIFNNRCGYSGFGAQVGGSYFRAQFFFRVEGGTERSCFANSFSREGFLTAGAIDSLVQRSRINSSALANSSRGGSVMRSVVELQKGFEPA
jgi:hypothetical protein